ncbi:MAG: MBL fold metallo-hydrolase [Alphaproteobacteria bacterium]|nr:MBL fold metallo-hydrolase [Alphaproteobacteria bacterium]
MTTRRIGSMEVTRIEESHGTGFPPNFLLPDWDPAVLDEHRDWLVPNYYNEAEGKMVSSIHSWLIRTGSHNILIDTCCGNQKNRPDFPRFHMRDTPYLDRLKAAGVAREEVDFVMCTHLHVDHVGWNTHLVDGKWQPTFPNAKYVFSQVERDFWDPSRNPNLNDSAKRIFEDSLAPVLDAGLAQTVNMTDQIGDSLLIEPAPGHAPGHVIFRLLDGGDEGVFIGDVMHHPIQVYRPEWSSGFDTDPRMAEASRRRVLDHCADCNARVFPAHFGAPHIGRVKRKGSGYRFEFDHGEGA